MAEELNPPLLSRDNDEGGEGFREAPAAVHAMGPRSRRTPVWILALMHSQWATDALLNRRISQSRGRTGEIRDPIQLGSALNSGKGPLNFRSFPISVISFSSDPGSSREAWGRCWLQRASAASSPRAVLLARCCFSLPRLPCRGRLSSRPRHFWDWDRAAEQGPEIPLV